MSNNGEGLVPTQLNVPDLADSPWRGAYMLREVDGGWAGGEERGNRV